MDNKNAEISDEDLVNTYSSNPFAWRFNTNFLRSVLKKNKINFKCSFKYG